MRFVFFRNSHSKIFKPIQAKWALLLVCLLIKSSLLFTDDIAHPQTEYLIQGVVLVPSKQCLLSEEKLSGITGIQTHNVSLPKGTQTLKKYLKNVTFNQPFTEEVYVDTEKAISKFYYDYNDPFVIVTIPDQDPSTGVLQVIIIHAKIGQINYEGNKWTSDKKLNQCIRSKPGEEINLSRLDRSLYNLNRNPFRRVDLIYSPGSEPGTTDLTMVVNDRRPIRIYAGFNNSGVDNTDRQRWLTGITWGDVWGIDHILSIQYLAAFSIKRFQAITLQYAAPFQWGHSLNIYGGYSLLNAKLPYPSMKSRGKSYQGSLRYSIPYCTTKGNTGEGFVGFDVKGTNNTLEYSERFQNFSNIVNLTQAVVGFNQTIERESWRIDLMAELDWSPGRIIANQTNARYEALRPDAKNHWVIVRGSFKYLQNIIKNLKFYLYTRGQIASQNLLPSEQLGLGGYDTVRGYTERQLNYDSGLITTAEIRFFDFSLSKGIWKNRLQDSGHFVLFADYGYGHNHNLLPSEPDSDYLLGVGPGIRYTLQPMITASLDWGIKLHHNSIFEGGGSMLYFNVMLNY